MHRAATIASALLAVTAVALPSSAAAQVRLEPRSGTFWAISVASTAGAAALDVAIRNWATRHQTPTLDHLARDIDPLGRARYLLPALVAGVVVPRVVGNSRLSDAVVRIALGYAAADGIESALKGAVGRHRPVDDGGPGRFRPFRGGGDWGSLPSGHTTHAMSLATGIALESHSRWLAVPAFGLASAVALQRTYTRAHWASDVVLSTALAISASSTVIHWLERRGAARDPASGTARPHG